MAVDLLDRGRTHRVSRRRLLLSRGERLGHAASLEDAQDGAGRVAFLLAGSPTVAYKDFGMQSG